MRLNFAQNQINLKNIAKDFLIFAKVVEFRKNLVTLVSTDRSAFINLVQSNRMALAETYTITLLNNNEKCKMS